MNEQSANTTAETGFITEAACKVFSWLEWLSPMRALSAFVPLLKPPRLLTAAERQGQALAACRRRAGEWYTAAWWVVEIILFIVTMVMPMPRKPLLVIPLMLIAGLRNIDILQVAANKTLFDVPAAALQAASRGRQFVLEGIHFFEMIVCFGIIYAFDMDYFLGVGQPITAYYFSAMNQLTATAGNVVPGDWIRMLAAVQVLASVIFILLVFGRYVASFSQKHAQ